jgi:hypothetical protein
LVINQVTEKFKVFKPKLIKYYRKVIKLVKYIFEVTLNELTRGDLVEKTKEKTT